ncbi:protein translocase subunit SecD [Angustibacter luteus]|uniref:Protein translocase subunit SecD n=1 Tax=Angustibacter luteus TaxID=658456 RepID=A0ABW1JA47_9ACTN
MAGPNKRHGRPSRPLLALLGLILVLGGVIAAQVKWADGQWTPQLGLDLEGGTQIVLQPVIKGGGKVDDATLRQSVDIIRARIDGSGVGEAEITTEGGRNIVVAVPGKVTDAQRRLITQSSQLQFRPVLAEAAAQPTPTATSTATSTPSGTATGTATPKATATATASPTTSSEKAALPQSLLKSGTTATPSATPTASASPTASGAVTPAPKPTSPSDLNQITPQIQAQFEAETCSDATKLPDSQADPNAPLVTCSADLSTKYILGPVEVDGSDIKSATAGLQQLQNGGTSTTWEIQLAFNGEGTDKFSETTTRLYTLTPPQNQFAIVLDGRVISAPQTNEPITGGTASITGNFTQKSSLELANQLKYGALPLSFTKQTEEEISPLLGKEQLQRGLIAGLIGLLLVVLYSLLQYRALGFVTVASLLVAGVITYEVVVVLGNSSGLRLTLAGITGLIVSIGVTADSFIVYFERVRDEVRDGRSLRSAVDTGWKRARRTILAADSINFLAAVVLYILAAGGVRGFAYTLGLATIIDVVVVVLFTHPLLTILARTKFFGQGHRWSGLDPERLGAGTAIGVKANLGTIASRRAAAATTPQDA